MALLLIHQISHLIALSSMLISREWIAIKAVVRTIHLREFLIKPANSGDNMSALGTREDMLRTILTDVPLKPHLHM